MLQINNVYKTLDQNEVLNGITLHAKKGSIYGLVGPNGAGKTTLIRTIAGILTPDSGSIIINGKPLSNHNIIAKQRLGYIPDNPLYFPHYRISELAQMYRESYPQWNEDRYTAMLDLFELHKNQKMKHLSKGMKARVMILLNLSIMPELLLLDEPTSGLDPVIRHEFLNMLVEEAEQYGTTLFISTHNLDELERICDYIGIIHRGRMLTESELDDLKEKIRKIQVVFNNGLPEELSSHADIMRIEQAGRVSRIIVKNNFEDVLETARRLNPIILETIDMSLNEIFINQLGGEGYVINKK